MKNSPYKGRVLDFDEVFHIYQVLKFYYEDLETLPPAAVADIMKLEFGCMTTENDVYLYLLTVQNRDTEGNLKCHD